MKQNYNELKLSTSQYNENFGESETKFGKIQKIYSTPHLICLVIRFKGKTTYLYLGRGSSYQGLWQGSNQPPKEFRIKDSFLEYLRKNIENSNIIRIQIDKIDRVIYIPYYKDKKINCFSFFWRGKDLIFSNIYAENENYFIFNSWVGKKEKIDFDFTQEFSELYKIVERFLDFIGRKKLQKVGKIPKKRPELESFLNLYFSADNNILYKKEKNKKLKFLERKLQKITDDIKKLSGIISVEGNLKNLNIDLEDMNFYTLGGKKVKFEKNWNSFKKRDFLFERIKKIKKGIEILVIRKKECELNLSRINNSDLEKKIDINKIKIIKPFWNKKEVKKKKSSNKKLNMGFEELILDNKIRLGIGLNSQGNDNLRKIFAKKNDFWFHLENYKSCHCIVKIENLSDITDEYFELIGSIIRDKSNLLIDIIPLVFTQVKNLKGLKGRPGAVTLKKEKYRDVKYNRDWREIISKN